MMKMTSVINPVLLLLLLLLSLSATPVKGAEKYAQPKCPLLVPEEDRTKRRPVVFGHRGAAYNLPENTLPALRLALELGADSVNVDVVSTKDHVLIANWDMDLNRTTDVAAKFPGRSRTSQFFMDTQTKQMGATWYYAHDFTLDEIKQLTVHQRIDDGTLRSSAYDGMFQIPTLDEIIELLYDWNSIVRSAIGSDDFYTETRPALNIMTWGEVAVKADANINLADLVITTLRTNSKARELFFLNTECSSASADQQYLAPPLVLSSFHLGTLAYMRSAISEDPWHRFEGVVPPIQLMVGESHCQNDDFWSEIEELMPNGLAPNKKCLESVARGKAERFMKRARKLNLAVHPASQRLERRFIDKKFTNAESEMAYMFCDMKVDGIFAENVDLAVRVGERGCNHYLPYDADETDTAHFHDDPSSSSSSSSNETETNPTTAGGVDGGTTIQCEGYHENWFRTCITIFGSMLLGMILLQCCQWRCLSSSSSSASGGWSPMMNPGSMMLTTKRNGMNNFGPVEEMEIM